jgi:hypothetical protein
MSTTLSALLTSSFTGAAGPSNVVNATNDTATTTLYPVFVGAADSNQTPKITTTKLAWNANTGSLGIGTTSPSTYGKLVVDTVGGNAVVFGDIATPANETTLYLRSTLATIATASAGALRFTTGSGGTERMRIDSAGNLGLGVTPQSWYANTWAIELGNRYASIYSGSGQSSSPNIIMATNSYSKTATGLDTYIATGFASKYVQSNANHIWYNAPSGTADTSITFTQAMTLTSGGDLGVGDTDPTGGYAWNSTSRVIGVSGDASASAGAYGVVNLDNNRATPSSGDLFGIVGFTSSNSVAGQTLKAYIVGAAEGAGGVTGGFGGNLRFYTKPDNSGAGPVERMRITSTGGVSFGATGTAYGTSGQVLTSAGNDPPTWTTITTGGMTLLGTISTASGTSVSLTGLTLTSYKQLVCVFNSVVMTAVAGVNFTLNSINLTKGGAKTYVGQIFIDLTSGAFSGSTGVTAGTASEAISAVGSSGLTTASTSITFGTSGTTPAFGGGSILVFGVK